MTASADLLSGYRSAREAQLVRFDTATQGVDRSLGKTPEWDVYFGQGEYSGAGVEPALTFKDYVRGLRQSEHDPLPLPEDTGIRPELAFCLLREELEDLAASGDPGAVRELERRAAKRAGRRAKRAGVTP